MSISTLPLLEQFSNAPGVSGFEDEVLLVGRRYAQAFANLEEDSIRNLYMAHKENKGNRPVVMLDAHSDEVGFMVQAVKPDGTLAFLPLGGWVGHTVPAHKVRVRNRDGEYIPGVVATTPPHFLTDAQKGQSIAMTSLSIDVGASSKEEAEEIFGIEVGAPVVPDVMFEVIEQNNTILGKGFDCRLGCGAVIKTLDALCGRPRQVDVVGVLSSQEEVGARGAKVSAQHISPDVCIVFEGTPADDTLSSSFGPQAALHHGPQVRHMDKSMITNPRFLKMARQTARELGIPFQDAVRSGGSTDGGPVHLTNLGIPCIVIGIPVRYIHTHHCFAAVEDFENAVKWACAIIERLDSERIQGF